MMTTLPLSRSNPAAAAGPSHQLYMLLREAPDRAAATAYLQRRLAEAGALPPAWSGGMQGLEEWLELRGRNRAEEFRQYQQGRQEGAPRRHFATLAQARRFLCVQAPGLLVEGAWLHSVLDHWRQAAYMPLVKLYLDYLGKGVPTANHVAQVRQVLAVQACSTWQDLEDSGFVQGAIRLALASAGEHYLPELLGYQLAVPDQPAAQPSLLLELAELGIALPPPPPSDTPILNVLRAMLGAEPDTAPRFLQQVEVGYALGRIGLQTLPATPEDGAPQDAPVANGSAHAAIFATPAGGTDGAATASPAPEQPRPILRHRFDGDEHAWETITSDLGLLEAQIAACGGKAEAMTMLARHMGPAVHHQPLGLMAARVYAQLFALA
ncbi:hypothetical protein SAMN05518865_108182 [Duganella sp. CF458]|uniref:hypothetical protein n=1 Tax=Duganella sp. CF458 TaxID=1884368 RepID=UPI0008E2F9E1|nr:hypothetical protein [Duganella sp. CF458]SFG11583.1 hypothetical protein SAMN05518865_108182 [Duganella sp. CF458]